MVISVMSEPFTSTNGRLKSSFMLFYNIGHYTNARFIVVHWLKQNKIERKRMLLYNDMIMGLQSVN